MLQDESDTVFRGPVIPTFSTLRGLGAVAIVPIEREAPLSSDKPAHQIAIRVRILAGFLEREVVQGCRCVVVAHCLAAK